MTRSWDSWKVFDGVSVFSWSGNSDDLSPIENLRAIVNVPDFN